MSQPQWWENSRFFIQGMVPVLCLQKYFMVGQKTYTYSFLSGIYINELFLTVCLGFFYRQWRGVIHWLYAAVGRYSVQSTHTNVAQSPSWKQMIDVTLSGPFRSSIQWPGRAFSFPGSTYKWKLMGVILLDTYPLTVLSFVPGSIQRDI